MPGVQSIQDTDMRGEQLVEAISFVTAMPYLQTTMTHVCRAWACVSLSFEWHAPQY
jgi:hypothetical protein